MIYPMFISNLLIFITNCYTQSFVVDYSVCCTGEKERRMRNCLFSVGDYKMSLIRVVDSERIDYLDTVDGTGTICPVCFKRVYRRFCSTKVGFLLLRVVVSLAQTKETEEHMVPVINGQIYFKNDSSRTRLLVYSKRGFETISITRQGKKVFRMWSEKTAFDVTRIAAEFTGCAYGNLSAFKYKEWEEDTFYRTFKWVVPGADETVLAAYDVFVRMYQYDRAGRASNKFVRSNRFIQRFINNSLAVWKQMHRNMMGGLPEETRTVEEHKKRIEKGVGIVFVDYTRKAGDDEVESTMNIEELFKTEKEEKKSKGKPIRKTVHRKKGSKLVIGLGMVIMVIAILGTIVLRILKRRWNKKEGEVNTTK
ncbi:hypothetical protein ECANGB1_986 [Enterospora canceri]|uniref:Uncharacterized protein n=1 Tax=Enterospora canceri TaxID=1081671 RepID=A0A1Y1S4T9_9MICR|nr:hypothetical protein ECANGB1_986 [Enterospora canceri]